MTLAHLVREWRARKGISLRAAGQLLEVDHNTIKGIEMGRRPTYPVLLKLSRVLRRTPKSLIAMALEKTGGDQP